VATALSTELQPLGANPPWFVRWPAWKPEASSAMIVSAGTMNLTAVTAVLIRANSLMPYQLMTVSTASSAAATRMPPTESVVPWKSHGQ
jgi:hypothetical protein